MQRLRSCSTKLLQACAAQPRLMTCSGMAASSSTHGACLSHSLPPLVCVAPFQMSGWSDHLQWKPFSASIWLQEATKQTSSGRASSQGSKGLIQKQDRYEEITDQIPEIVKPMGVLEGTSYTLLIVAGLAFAASELLFQPKEYTCFNMTLKKLQDDPRITVRLGTPVTGFGQDTRNRQARQRIPNRVFTDAHGVEHIQIQFFARGPNATGRVSADLYLDSYKQWQYTFLFMDMDGQRVNLIEATPLFASG